ncbi:hypothetical protein [Actinomadura macrotermitis]|uniref:Uncharacterized protein n=1 Tax=Actinomadura macrotermitis TaxID=2585200 RepID=A0A7K0BZ65_9ACTN|nr:hypothetical protein [Actinomadura macrotermitis]MQY06478.1 hypothetical protein [Actinomadura macrotermitis]
MTNPSVPFGRWRLRGGRYEKAGLPVEALPEFARYERLVIDVAKGLYKRRHRERVRAPRGFTDNFELRLTDIQPGSVIPVLEAPATPEDALFNGVDSSIFEEARILIQDTLRSIHQQGKIPPSFPPQALKEFSRFGRSLQDDETLEFDPGTNHSAIYTQSIRRTIQEIADLDRFEVETILIGQVVSIMADRSAFEFRVGREGKTVSGHFSSDEIVRELKAYLDSSSMAPTVSISCVALQSGDRQIVEIQDVLGIEPVLPEEWNSRLREIEGLPDGWLDGDGMSISRRVLRQAESLLLDFLDSGIEKPRIYPMPSGGVQFEWLLELAEVSAEILPSGQVSLFAFSKLDEEREFELETSWSETSNINNFIRRSLDELAE